MTGRWRATARRSGTLRAHVACGTAGEEVLDPTPYIRGCVRANRVD